MSVAREPWLRISGRVFGVRALAVDELLRGKGLATQMLGEMKEELAIVAGECYVSLSSSVRPYSSVWFISVKSSAR